MKVINKPILITVSVFVALGAFVFGYALVSISMMAQRIIKHNNLSEEDSHFQLSVITTLLPFGAFLGTFLTNPIVKILGERKSMVYLDIFAFLIITYQSYFMDVSSLYFTRFSLGLYLGVSGTVIPTYLVSISPPQMTGLIGSFNQLLITLGVAVGYRLGMIVDITWERYIFFAAYFCILRIICLLYFRFDSLEKHFKNNETEFLEKYTQLFYENGSVQELLKLRGFSNQSASAKDELQPKNQEKGKQSFIDSLTGSAPQKIVVMGFVIAMANQLSGINAILYYAKQIFEKIVSPQEALNNAYYLGLLQVFVTFISGFMINSCGRRTLTLYGSSIIVFSLVTAFILDALIESSEKMVIMLIFLHIIGFSISLGPISFIYAAEIMENLGFVVVVNWVFTILVSLFSEIMINSFGIGKVFLFYGLSTLACLLYMQKFMVESKGLTRSQIVAKYYEQDASSSSNSSSLPKRGEQQAISLKKSMSTDS